MNNIAILILAIVFGCVCWITMKNSKQYKYNRFFRKYNKFESDAINVLQSTYSRNVKPLGKLRYY